MRTRTNNALIWGACPGLHVHGPASSLPHAVRAHAPCFLQACKEYHSMLQQVYTNLVLPPYVLNVDAVKDYDAQGQSVSHCHWHADSCEARADRFHLRTYLRKISKRCSICKK